MLLYYKSTPPCLEEYLQTGRSYIVTYLYTYSNISIYQPYREQTIVVYISIQV